MAYILIAVGALMAAAGLYVVGYGWVEARFDEYWAVVSTGATLIAGGMVTLAMGVAVRALLQMKAALMTHPAPGVPAVDEPSLSPIRAAAGPHDVLSAAESEPARLDPPEPQLPHEPAIGTPGPRLPHPLRRVPKPSTSPEPAADAAVAVAGLAEQVGDASETTVPSAAEPALGHDTENGSIGADAQHVEPVDHHIDPSAESDVNAARPADDYKLEMPSTPDHDLPALMPAKDDDASEPEPHATSASVAPASEDWLDRALADLDEELPLTVAPQRTASMPILAPTGPSAEATEPGRLEPAMAASESSLAAEDETPRSVPSETAPAAPQVIGRYEADGTSYVMFADGSIEAQSSAGVYRFSSMAELKAFIET